MPKGAGLEQYPRCAAGDCRRRQPYCFIGTTSHSHANTVIVDPL